MHSDKKSKSPNVCILNKATLPCGFISHGVNKCPFHSLLSDMFCFVFFSCMLVVGILLSKMSPKFSTEVLSSISKSKKALMCFTEKIHALDKLHSISYSTVVCESNVNKSTIHTK